MTLKMLKIQPKPDSAQQTTGVVIWSDAARKLAVIWCTDHGRLAYLTGPDDLRDAADWPIDGDLVGFQLLEPAGLRRCAGLHVIARNWHPELAEALRMASESGALEADERDETAPNTALPLPRLRAV